LNNPHNESSAQFHYCWNILKIVNIAINISY
jgi:hypothetical protein